MRVVAVDTSLTSTGLASSDGWVSRVRSKPTGRLLEDREVRLREIVDTILLTIQHRGMPDLVVVEAPMYAGSKSSASVHDRAGLWWLLVSQVRAAKVPVVEIPPTCRVKYACGKGNAPKDQVMASAIRRYPQYDVSGNDIADAVVLMQMALDHYGLIPDGSLYSVPKTNRTALERVQWPALTLGKDI